MRSIDLKILEALATHGPRNISKVARAVRVPRPTLQDWIKRMSSSPHFYLRFFANLYHTHLGLKKSVAFIEANPGHESLLLDCLKVNDFWIYLTRCHGMFDGYIAEYAIPKDHEEEFERFLKQIEKLGIAKNVRIFWSTCFENVNPTSNWFDEKSEEWMFPWHKWIEEVPTKGTELPRSLIEPKSYPVEADRTDILILKELEKDATIPFSELAEIVGLTPQAVGRRYKKLLELRIIDDFQICFMCYGLQNSKMAFFIFTFECHEKMAKFANALLHKPFVFIVGKIFGRNALVSQIYLPTKEFQRFRASLSELMRKGLLKTYIYAIQDEPRFRQTISYEFFENYSWTYDHQKHMESLQKATRKILLKEYDS